MSQLYSFWEVYRFGKDKDKFEVASSPVPSFVGTKVELKNSAGAGLVMKREGQYNNDDAGSLQPAYGAITAAKFKRVEEYTKISLDAALIRIRNYENVYVKDGLNYERVTSYTDFEDLDIEDFDDLFTTEFYIKK